MTKSASHQSEFARNSLKFSAGRIVLDSRPPGMSRMEIRNTTAFDFLTVRQRSRYRRLNVLRISLRIVWQMLLLRRRSFAWQRGALPSCSGVAGEATTLPKRLEGRGPAGRGKKGIYGATERHTEGHASTQLIGDLRYAAGGFRWCDFLDSFELGSLPESWCQFQHPLAAYPQTLTQRISKCDAYPSSMTRWVFKNMPHLLSHHSVLSMG